MRSNLTIYTSKLALEKNTWIGLRRKDSEYCEVLNVTGERKRQKCNTFLHYSCKLFSGRSRNAPIRNEVILYSKIPGIFFLKDPYLSISILLICFYCIHLYTHTGYTAKCFSKNVYKKANKQNQKGINNSHKQAFNKSGRHLEFSMNDVIRGKTSAAIFEFWLAWQYHVRTRGKVRPLWIALFHYFPV